MKRKKGRIRKKYILMYVILLSLQVLNCMFDDGVIRGNVYFSGDDPDNPTAGLMVYIQNTGSGEIFQKKSKSDEYGFEFSDLDGGEWLVTVIDLPDKCYTTTNYITIKEDYSCSSTDTHDVDFVIEYGRSGNGEYIGEEYGICFLPSVSSNRCVEILTENDCIIKPNSYYRGSSGCGYYFYIYWISDADPTTLEAYDEVKGVYAVTYVAE